MPNNFISLSYSNKPKNIYLPRETNIERIIDKHLPRRFGLRLAFVSKNGEIRTALNPPFSIPRALPMPHQHHSFRSFQRRKRHRSTNFETQFLIIFHLR